MNSLKYSLSDSLSYLQMKVLKDAKHVHPNAWWWVMADGCDIVSGLKESVKKEWSGDVDLNDGAVLTLHTQYMESLKFLGSVGIGPRRSHEILKSDLQTLKYNLATQLTSVSSSNIYSCFTRFPFGYRS